MRSKEALNIELIGTRKQIDWAGDIRENWMSGVRRDLPGYVQEKIEKARDALLDQAQIMGLEQALTNVLVTRLAAIDDVVAQTRAAWWIDRRGGGLNDRINKTTDDALRCELAYLQSGLTGAA